MSMRVPLAIYGFVAITIGGVASLMALPGWLLDRNALSYDRPAKATLLSAKPVHFGSGKGRSAHYTVTLDVPDRNVTVPERIFVPVDHCRFDFDVQKYFSTPNTIAFDLRPTLSPLVKKAVIPRCVEDMSNFLQWLALFAASGVAALIATNKLKDPDTEYAEEVMSRASRGMT